MASEGELGRKWDRCLADSAVKLGKGGEGLAQEEGLGRSGGGSVCIWGCACRRSAGFALRPCPAGRAPCGLVPPKGPGRAAERRAERRGVPELRPHREGRGAERLERTPQGDLGGGLGPPLL